MCVLLSRRPLNHLPGAWLGLHEREGKAGNHGVEVETALETISVYGQIAMSVLWIGKSVMGARKRGLEDAKYTVQPLE